MFLALVFIFTIGAVPIYAEGEATFVPMAEQLIIPTPQLDKIKQEEQNVPAETEILRPDGEPSDTEEVEPDEEPGPADSETQPDIIIPEQPLDNMQVDDSGIREDTVLPIDDEVPPEPVIKTPFEEFVDAIDNGEETITISEPIVIDTTYSVSPDTQVTIVVDSTFKGDAALIINPGVSVNIDNIIINGNEKAVAGIDVYGGLIASKLEVFGFNNRGIYVNDGGSVTLDSSHIHNNSGMGGAGIYVDKGGYFSMLDTTVSYNEAKDRDSDEECKGGGIFIRGVVGPLTGDISYNVSSSVGGGIYIEYDTTVELEDVAVFDNIGKLGQNLYFCQNGGLDIREGANFYMHGDNDYDVYSYPKNPGVSLNFGEYPVVSVATGNEITTLTSEEGLGLRANAKDIEYGTYGLTIHDNECVARSMWANWGILDIGGGGIACNGSLIITGTADPEPETTQLVVNKVWHDYNNQLMEATVESITVELYDGENKIDEVTLSDENGWSYTFTELPIDGDYYVNEIAVNGFTNSVVSDNGVITITNTQNPPPPPPSYHHRDPDPEPTPEPDPEPDIDIPDDPPPLADIPDEEPPLADIPDEEPPLADIPEEEPPLVEEPPLMDIPEDDVPLAEVPQTGDATGMYAISMFVAGVGLVVLCRKRYTYGS